MEEGAGLKLFMETVRGDAQRGVQVGLPDEAAALLAALEQLGAVSAVLTSLQRTDPDLALANASIYLDVFGRVTLAWIWLQQGVAATSALRSDDVGISADYYRGKLQAMHYFFQWELPQAAAQWALLARCDRSAYDMRDGWFA
jgi:hypothetical protein